MSITTVREHGRRWGAAFGIVLLVSPTWTEAARLQVETSDGPRRVWVGGEFAGLAPVTIDSLPPGATHVSVGEPDSSAAWVLPWTTQVEITDSAPRTLVVPPLQRLRIQTPPISAELEVNGVAVGSSPLQLLVPADRPVQLEIRGEGLEPQAWTYQPGGQPDSTLRVTLSIAGTGRARAEAALNSGIFGRSATLLPIGAVIAGVAGVWARQTADRAYDKYLHTIDRHRMRKQLDRANNYDDIAVGCWIAAEVLLAASAWTWLRASVSDAHGDLPHPEARIGVSLDQLLERETP